MTQQRTRTPFGAFDGSRYMLVTTSKGDGTPVSTPVGTYLVGDRLFLLTDPRSGKVKRIRRNPHVTVAPCSFHGAQKGHTHHARARVLDMTEAEEIARTFAADRPITYHLGRILSDLRGGSEIFIELLPGAEPPPASTGAPTRPDSSRAA